MDLSQLEMLVATVEAGSTQKAAARVFRTQPAVSMALRKLESEIGSPLFDRSIRGAHVLTRQGEMLYACAKRMLRLREETLADISSLRDLRSGKLRIGANESTGSYLLPDLVRQFKQSHPDIRVDVLRQNSTALISEVKEDLADLAFVSFSPEDADIEATAVMTDALVLIVGPRHPFRSRAKVHFRDLGTESFLAHNVSSPSRVKVIEAFQESGTQLDISMEISSVEMIKRLVAMGVGIAFVPAMCVREEVEQGELAQIQVEGFSYKRTLWMIRRRARAHSDASREFSRLVKNVLNVFGKDSVHAS